jgi:hypothetical protein
MLTGTGEAARMEWQPQVARWLRSWLQRRELDVHFISSLPVQRLSACTAWGEKRPAQIVGAES